MGTVKLSAGYRLPKGVTLADVRRLDQELFGTEELEVPSPQANNETEETPPDKE